MSIKLPVNVVTLKWGTLYSAEFVNKLYRAVMDNITLPCRFVCFTDDPIGLDTGIANYPIPDFEIAPARLTSNWRKLCLFTGQLPLEGLCLFLDLDVMITGNMDDFFTYQPDKIPIIKDWTPLGRRLFPKGPQVGNSSVFRFEANKATYVQDQYQREKHWAVAKFKPPQSYLTHCIRPNMVFWPSRWCVSFKASLKPRFPLNYFIAPKKPADAKIVVFHGLPNQDQAAVGYRGRKPHHFIKPTKWVREYWEKY